MAGIDNFINNQTVQSIGQSMAVSAVRMLLPQVSAMMALGLFVFGLHTLPYQQLQRQTQWRHPSAARVGRRPARQFVGEGDDTFTLSGTLMPEITGGKVSLALVRAMADTGKSWPLLEGSGTFYGFYVIESIDQTGSLFFSDGSPRKIDFSIKLVRVDDDNLSLMGVIDQSLSVLL